MPNSQRLTREEWRARRDQIQTQALTRAVSGQSLLNYEAIITGFIEKGIPAEQIAPRENVFTFNAWKAQGRFVRRGEHGVKCITWIDAAGKNEQGDQDHQKEKPQHEYRSGHEPRRTEDTQRRRIESRP